MMNTSTSPTKLGNALLAASKLREAAASNPLGWTDDKILEKVYLTHVHTAEKHDVVSLLNVTSNIIKRSAALADSVALKTGPPVGLIEDKAPLPGFDPPFRTMKYIASQMMSCPHGEHNAHQMALSILDQLKTYPWDGKAILVLAAFALEYGNFWHLVQVPSGDQLGRSLAQMNRVQSIEKNRQAIADYNSLVKNLLHAVECITELERLSTKGYDPKDVPELSEALQEIPVAVYWAIITTVVCANDIDILVGDSDDRYDLSIFDDKLAGIISKLKAHLTRSRKKIAELEDYRWRKRSLQTPTEIVEVLKVLIFHNEMHDPHLVYDGSIRQTVSLEVLRRKHVLLFISGLQSIRDEIRLLQSIYEGLQEEPREVKGYRKEDFKILWIPVVDEWNITHKAEYDSLKHEMPWYVVEYFYPLAGIRLIREDLNYKNKPIVPVLNPQGRVVNYNAMHMIFVWGIDAFPFRPNDDEMLTQKWNWFWSEMKRVHPRLQDIIKADSFIFIYGGMDEEWMQKFAAAVEKIKRHEIIKRADAVIESYAFGREDQRIVPRFWTGVESQFANIIQKKTRDPTVDEIKSLLCLKHHDPGWVLLSKGSNVKLLGPGDRMLATADEFEIWKDKVLQRAGFDIAFKEYYDQKGEAFPTACAHMQLANYPSNILDNPIDCPDFSCGRNMEIESVTYKCCHGHSNNTDDHLTPGLTGDNVLIEKKYAS